MMETIELSRFGVIVSYQNIEEPDEVNRLSTESEKI